MHAKTPIIPGATTGDLLVNISNLLTGEAEQGVTCSILAINFIAVSDINGQIAKNLLLPAEYSAILTKVNCTPIQFTFIIIAGQTNEIGFLMETINPTSINLTKNSNNYSYSKVWSK